MEKMNTMGTQCYKNQQKTVKTSLPIDPQIKGDLGFFPKNLNPRSFTDSNASQIVYSNYKFFFLREHDRSRFLAISQKCYHLLKWKLRKLVLWYIHVSTTRKDWNKPWVPITKPIQSISEAISYLVRILEFRRGHVSDASHGLQWRLIEEWRLTVHHLHYHDT